MFRHQVHTAKELFAFFFFLYTALDHFFPSNFVTVLGISLLLLFYSLTITSGPWMLRGRVRESKLPCTKRPDSGKMGTFEIPLTLHDECRIAH